MKRIYAFAIRAFLFATLIAAASPALRAQGKVATVEISPPASDAVAGQKMKFTATAKDESGKTLDAKPSFWVALPVDSASADEEVREHDRRHRSVGLHGWSDSSCHAG